MKTFLKLIFSGEKCLKSTLFNLLGLQIFRYLQSKFLYELKYFLNKNNNFLDIIKSGFGQKINLLCRSDFLKIQDEYFLAIENPKYKKIIFQTKDKQIEGVEYIQVDIDERIKKDYPNLYNLTQNNYIKNYFESSEQKKNIKIFCRLERIKIIDNTVPDPNKFYHFDTFHNTFKAWLFINNVESSDGPLYLLPGTHKISFKRVYTEWVQSILFSFKNISPSFRVGNDKKFFLDNEAVKFDVKENTLVMANTHALHRRGDGVVGAVRDSVQFWTRENPFKIFI